MVENRPVVNIFTWVCIIFGVILIIFPIWVAFVASTHSLSEIMNGMPLLPGHDFIKNYKTLLVNGIPGINASFGRMLFNSLIMALGVAVFKIIISILSAYAMVFFRFRGRSIFFWTIFITLMLPIEVRILPTFQVAANLHLLNSYSGLILPVIASATATFLFRQFFMAVPGELLEAARIDGAGPVRFFFDILLPLSKTNLAALFVIMFIYGWNQYLWPLIATTDTSHMTIVMSINSLVNAVDSQPLWQYIMAVAMLAMIPPVIVIILMQRVFVKGLVDTEK